MYTEFVVEPITRIARLTFDADERTFDALRRNTPVNQDVKQWTADRDRLCCLSTGVRDPAGAEPSRRPPSNENVAHRYMVHLRPEVQYMNDWLDEQISMKVKQEGLRGGRSSLSVSGKASASSRSRGSSDLAEIGAWADDEVEKHVICNDRK